MSAFVIGSTGLVGSHIVENALGNFEGVKTITRRPLKKELEKAKDLLESDLGKWPKLITEQAKESRVFFSAFGTTRKDAGGIENFRKIDYGTNYECAKAAKEAGVETFVLVSSGGANKGSWVPYLQIKGQLEDDIIALKFPRTIILKPGLLLGQREKSKGWANSILAGLGLSMHGTFVQRYTSVQASDVAYTAVNLAKEPFEGDQIVKYVGNQEINKLASKNEAKK